MPRIRADQIRGVNSETIQRDVQLLTDQTKSYQSPVANINTLPLTGNYDGDIRLVIDRDELYIWNATTSEWKEHADKITESRTMAITITKDGQKTIVPGILVGVENGLASLDALSLEVNGVTQSKNVDYTLGTSLDTIPKLIITWKSTDFQLEITDNITVIYDMLLLK